MENDLISRSALSGKAKWMKDQFGIPLRAIPISELGLAPAVDAVEVVRCKVCKFYETNVEYYGGGTKDVCRLLRRQMQYDDFCSYGERGADDGMP